MHQKPKKCKLQLAHTICYRPLRQTQHFKKQHGERTLLVYKLAFLTDSAEKEETAKCHFESDSRGKLLELISTDYNQCHVTKPHFSAQVIPVLSEIYTISKPPRQSKV